MDALAPRTTVLGFDRSWPLTRFANRKATAAGTRPRSEPSPSAVGIRLESASVDIPIYNARGRSLRTSMLRRIGGAVASDERNVVTVRALHDITLTIEPGERLALVGHNGAGKSTLLRVLSGAYEPTSGTAQIQGRAAALLDLMMGMDAELTGAENIVLRGAFVGLSIGEARSRIAEIAAFSGLGPFLHLPLRTYSSGMTLRLAFAISTVRAPDILLMDELVSVGDADFARKARERIERMICDSSIFVLASHDPDILKQYCNRALLLEQGTVVADGAVEAILETYAARTSL